MGRRFCVPPKPGSRPSFTCFVDHIWCVFYLLRFDVVGVSFYVWSIDRWMDGWMIISFGVDQLRYLGGLDWTRRPPSSSSSTFDRLWQGPHKIHYLPPAAPARSWGST